MKLSKTDYRGAPALRLDTKALSLLVPTGFGPRVIGFHARKSTENMFLEFAEGDGVHPPTGFQLRGGHRLWHSPEHIVRTYQPDNDPIKVTTTAKGLTLAPALEAETGIQKTVRIEVVNDRAVRLTHTLANKGHWPVELAVWPLTMFRRGGYAVLPLLPKGSHAAGDLLPNYSLVPWSYTDLSLPVWDFHPDYLGIDTTQATVAQKLGITAYPGWSAYWLDGQTFVKLAPPVSGARYPDMGSCFETFCNDTVIELETLSPLTTLEPGAKVSHVETWGLLEGLPRPDTDAAYRDKFLPAIQAWLKKL